MSEPPEEMLARARKIATPLGDMFDLNRPDARAIKHILSMIDVMASRISEITRSEMTHEEIIELFSELAE